MEPPPPRKRVGADPNPGWTAAPWAGVPHPSLRVSSGTAARATATPPPPPGFGASEDADAQSDRSTDDASTSERAVAAALEPVKWHAYFDEKVTVRAEPGTDAFRVYARRGGERNPSDATGTTRENENARAAHTDFRDPFANVAKRAPNVGPPPTETVILFAHGCAYTALSWATTVEHLAPQLDARVLLAAFDARHHGESVGAEWRNRSPESAEARSDVDVSAEQMARDAARVALAVVRRFRPTNGELNELNETFHGASPVKLVLVGHSMGGAAVTRAAAMVGECPAAYARDIDLRGVVLVDVSENGGASDALRATETFLAKRPKGFATKTDAVAWFVRSGMTTNLASARVSAPSQIRRATGTEENQGGRANESRDSRFVWILDARATAPHWRGWFEGLSRTFLSAKCAKLLVLAGVDRLDDELTIAQMQGKFQTVLVPGAGHAVHEDEPRATADAIAGFVKRFARARDTENETVSTIVVGSHTSTRYLPRTRN